MLFLFVVILPIVKSMETTTAVGKNFTNHRIKMGIISLEMSERCAPEAEMPVKFKAESSD